MIIGPRIHGGSRSRVSDPRSQDPRGQIPGVSRSEGSDPGGQISRSRSSDPRSQDPTTKMDHFRTYKIALITGYWHIHDMYRMRAL